MPTTIYEGDLVAVSRPVYDVTHYGAKGDGTTDDAPSIQSAINAAQNGGGGIVYFPQFNTSGTTVYKQQSGLIISKGNVALLGGSAPGATHDLGGYPQGPVLLWAGAAGGTQIAFVPPGPINLARAGVKNLSVFGNNTAGIGIQLQSCIFPIVEDVFLATHTAHSLWIGAASRGTITEGNDNTQHGLFQNLDIDNGFAAGDCIYLTGTVDGPTFTSGNASFNTFMTLRLRFKTGHGINAQNADNNTFVNTQTFAYSTGDGVRLQPGAASNGFLRYSGTTFRAQNGSLGNTLFWLDSANSSQAPIIEGNAALWWCYDNGSMNFVAPYDPATGLQSHFSYSGWNRNDSLGVQDDGAPVRGLNISTNAGATYGIRFWNGTAGSNLIAVLAPSGELYATGFVANAAAPTVGGGQIGFGSGTAATATAGGGQAVPSTVAGYFIINVAGTNVKVPYFNL